MYAILRKNIASSFTNSAASYGNRHVSCSLALRLRVFSTLNSGELVPSPVILDLLLHKHRISPRVASKVASVCRLKDPQKCDSILTFLRESGFSNIQLEKLLAYRPHYVSASLEDTIKPKLKVFQDLGYSSDDIAKIISSNPVILHLKFDTRVIPSLSILKRLLGTTDAVAKLLRRSGWFLFSNIETTLLPNIEFLKSCGMSMERILTLLYLFPRLLLLKPEILRKSVEKAERMGANRSSNMFIYALQAVCSVSSKGWELKLQAFRNCGFSEGDILTMFGKYPLVLSKSVKKLKGVKDVLLATGKYDMSCIVKNPSALSYSIEKRYKPRFQVLEILERKNLIEQWPTLSTVFLMPDEKFLKKFVDPYLSEVGEVHNAKRSARVKQRK